MRGPLVGWLLGSFLLLYSSSPAPAAWPVDGLPVCTAPGVQHAVVSCTDGAGGMILAWRDQRPGDPGLYVQRVGSGGTLRWTGNGVRVSAVGHGSGTASIAPDGRGGAWIVWDNQVNPYYDIYLQRIDADGAPAWAPAGGAAIRTGTVHFSPRRPVCVADGAGGVVVAFSELPLSGENLVVAQRFDADGIAQWTTPAIVAGEDIEDDGLLSAAVPYEGEGGILLAWVTSSGTGRAQWVDPTGTPRWSGTLGYGLGLVATDSRVKIARRERSDHGAHVLYQRTHEFAGHLYYEWRVKAIAESGVERWDEDAGDSRTTGPDANIHHAFGGGCVVGWYYLDGSPTEIYVYGRRFEGDGDIAWTQLLGHRPVAFSGAAPAVIWSEGSYFGYRFSWPALIDGHTRLMYRAMGHNPGEAIPDPGPLTLTSTWSTVTPTLEVCSTNSDVVLMGWRDERAITETDVYATALRTGGTLPYPNLVVRSLRATPNPAEVTSVPRIRGVVVNEGMCDAEAFSVAFWRDTPTPAGSPDWEGTYHEGLARLDSLVIEFDAPDPATTACTWQSWMRADFEEDVDEGTQENDNDRQLLLQWVATADLTIASFGASSVAPVAGSSITYTFDVTNHGHAPSAPCVLRLYHDRATAPSVGDPGDEDLAIPVLAAGAHHVVQSTPVACAEIGSWTSRALVDATGVVDELREYDNVGGPLTFTWNTPLDEGWPVTVGSGSLHSPAIADLPTVPRGQRAIVVTSTDGTCHAFDGQGDELTGWPYDARSRIGAGAAVADLDGDTHLETVFGDESGTLHCVGENGVRVWTVALGAPITTAAVLADLVGHDGALEVIVGDAAGRLHVLDHDGVAVSGWPLKLGASIVVAPAVGDLDRVPPLEIVAIASEGPLKSSVHVLRATGQSFDPRWPRSVDTSFSGSPAIGDVIGTSDLDIVAGGADGVLRAWIGRGIGADYQLDLGSPVRGSVTLADLDPFGDDLSMIVATDEYLATPWPGHWRSWLWAVEPPAGVLPGWPASLGYGSSNCRAGDGAIVWGDAKSVMIAIGSETGQCFVFDRSGDRMAGCTMPVAGAIRGSLAAHDVDGDQHLEVIVAGTGELRSYDLTEGSYAIQSLQWNQFGHDPQRTHCFGMGQVTAVDEPAVPSVPAVSTWVRAFPNPFNPRVTLVLDLAVEGRVHIDVFDASGRHVRTLSTEYPLPIGRHGFEWNGCDDHGQRVASGVYRVELKAPDTTATVDVVLVK